MIKIIDFTELNKDKLITDQAILGFALVEEQHYHDGDHLVFDDGVDIEKEIRNIKDWITAHDAARMIP